MTDPHEAALMVLASVGAQLDQAAAAVRDPHATADTQLDAIRTLKGLHALLTSMVAIERPDE